MIWNYFIDFAAVFGFVLLCANLFDKLVPLENRRKLSKYIFNQDPKGFRDFETDLITILVGFFYKKGHAEFGYNLRDLRWFRLILVSFVIFIFTITIAISSARNMDFFSAFYYFISWFDDSIFSFSYALFLLAVSSVPFDIMSLKITEQIFIKRKPKNFLIGVVTDIILSLLPLSIIVGVVLFYLYQWHDVPLNFLINNIELSMNHFVRMNTNFGILVGLPNVGGLIIFTIWSIILISILQVLALVLGYIFRNVIKLLNLTGKISSYSEISKHPFQVLGAIGVLILFPIIRAAI